LANGTGFPFSSSSTSGFPSPPMKFCIMVRPKARLTLSVLLSKRSANLLDGLELSNRWNWIVFHLRGDIDLFSLRKQEAVCMVSCATAWDSFPSSSGKFHPRGIAFQLLSSFRTLSIVQARFLGIR
jgi:hypothetical protein